MMSIHFKTAVIASVLVLQGCSVIGPGYASIGSADGTLAKNQSGWSSSKGSPEDAVIPITPEVNRTLAKFQPAAPSAATLSLLSDPKPYTIGAGDVVGILVYDHPELMPSSGAVISQLADPTGISAAPGLIVDAAGQITFPYIGRVKLSGLTEVEATELLTQKLAFYLKSPQITLRIQAFRSRRAYVEGAVRNAGMQIFTDLPMSLPEAINRAGGITPDGDRSNIVLTRHGHSFNLDLAALQTQGVDTTRMMLHNDDTVLVRSRDERKVYVVGEIMKPAPVLMRDGQLSLGQALGESSGINAATANPGQIYVIRKNLDGTPEIFHLNAHDPMMLAVADGFELQPRDVVYIDSVALVRWSRIVNLILPSAAVVNYGSTVESR